jgi:hypothetical protein
MINNNLAAHDRAASVPSAVEPSRGPRIPPHRSAASGEMRPPLVLWIYVARGVGRIILSVLALPFV